MAQPKRKTSKRRSSQRRNSKPYKVPLLARSNKDGSSFMPHHVNPFNGLYRGRKVLE